MARRPSSIDRLPPEVREAIGTLRNEGRTIDEILAKLRELSAEVSRSALGRHVKQLDAIGEEIRRSRAVAEAMVQRFGDAPESKTARLNIELMHSLMMKLMVGEEGEAVKLEPQDAYFAATALQRLAMASKADVDREVKIRKEMVGKAATAIDAAAARVEKTTGKKIDPETLRTIREEIYGIV